MQNVLEQGLTFLTFGVCSRKLSFRAIVFTCKDVFNPNVSMYISDQLRRGFAL